MPRNSSVSRPHKIGRTAPLTLDAKDADDLDDAVVRKGRKDNTYVLEMGDDGFPILPDHAEMDSDTRKAVVRAFLNWHYRECMKSVKSEQLNGLTALLEDCSGKPKDPVPWKEVIPRHDQLIPPVYLPDGKKIREPSRMNRHEATELLDFWYNRQKNCRDAVFEFYGWWNKAEKEVNPPVFNTSPPKDDHPAVAISNVKPGGKSKAATRTGRKSTSHAVIPSEDCAEEEREAPKAKSTQKKVVWSVKDMKHGSKRQPTSTSRRETDGSDDEFNEPDPSEEDSGDDVPAVGGGKKVHPTKQTAVTSKTKPGRASEAAPKPTQPPSRATEQSASRAPPTPLDIPRRVGPASRTVGASKKRSRDDESHASPEKRVRVDRNTKKRPTGDALQESPAKRTRSKTAEVPQKRSKKPNSRYNNFVRS